MYGKTNCSWASCREGCTTEIYKCHQIRVTYTPKRNYENDTLVEEIQEVEWANLARTEKEEEVNNDNLYNIVLIIIYLQRLMMTLEK